MIICYDKEFDNKPGDLIEIFDKKGNKIFELVYQEKKCAFNPSKAYENKIDYLKELYTKQSIK